MAISPVHQYSTDLSDLMQSAVDFFVQLHLIRAKQSFSFANNFHSMISKCNSPSKIEKKENNFPIRTEKKNWIVIDLGKYVTYLWCPMRLCRWIGSCLAFGSWFPYFFRKRLSNICRWLWFLHIETICVAVFICWWLGFLFFMATTE